MDVIEGKAKRAFFSLWPYIILLNIGTRIPSIASFLSFLLPKEPQTVIR